jgi:hypothetical protein
MVVDLFTCLCCGDSYDYECSHKVEGDGLVCADCVVECDWEVENVN